MDEEMEEFVTEAYEAEEIDMDYEFDAPKFYDFTRPESDWEAAEADDWFRFAASYSPSPFVVKLLNQKEGIPVEPVKTSAESKDVVVEDVRRIDSGSNNCMEAEVSAAVDDNNRECSNDMAQDTLSAKPKSPVKSPALSRSSTLMKPTASQLAKQNHHQDVHFNRLLRRCGKKLGNFDEKSLHSPSVDSQCTKRQKLDAGFVRKVAELRHQPILLHKAPKKIGADIARPKVTIPREPNLETAHRAQRRRYKVNAAKPGEQAKIYKAPPSPSRKKSTVPTTEFQVFHLRTAARAVQQTFNNVTNAPNSGYLPQRETAEIKGSNSIYALKQKKRETAFKCTACSVKKKTLPSQGESGIFSNIKQESTVGLKFPIDKRYLKEPPTDLFSKLSLASEAQNNAKPQSKSAFAC